MSNFLRCSLFFIITNLTYAQVQVLDASWKEIAHLKDSSWFATNEAKAVAGNVLLFQRDIGGWPKNIQMHKPLSEGKKRELNELKSIPRGCTIDNGATTQEMIFLSKMYRQTKNGQYRTAFLKGLDYLLEAQYENGGWPQFYPLRKGYYTHITYNDDAMVNVLRILKDIAGSKRFVHLDIPVEKVEKVRLAFEKGIDCILKTQYVQSGKLTVWCAQHDENTLLPAKARSYELPSLSGSESAKIVLLLLSVENPSDGVVAAIESAVKWFKETKIEGLREERVYNDNGKLIKKIMVPDAGAKPLWARFMELEDNRPFFCDRDGIKKESIEEIGEERRNGYKWYTDEPLEVLVKYPKWKDKITGKAIIKREIDIYNMIVAKDGTGDFTSIQEAINSAKGFPDKRVTIKVKNGIYKEKVEVYEWNTHMSIIGEDKDKTIITYDDYFDRLNLGRNSTFHTPTFLVQGNDFYAENLTIQNTAGQKGQAVALAVNADRVLIENCKIKGNQDTLYTTGEGFRQYYKDCYIEGTTDFIFGQATALFQNSVIHSKSDSYITAASTPKHMEFGYVFKDCKLTGTPGLGKVYLGRPWRTYAKTVFINCVMGDHIIPEGWDNWSNEKALRGTFYAEYNCSGPGFQPGKRVGWSHQLKKVEAKKYTVGNILGNQKMEGKPWYLNFRK
ncbi:pectate lyase [Maribacter polysiphoniae]|uniref:Pectinesterase n=1 Tax=Maribacter polysiphoniae TaxID=429344 RepID=A0A316E7M6_9FLAO|nr:pectate lyase [Maribacter polysiphoniae]MBD1262366.1 pectate lyase [Maribacter polysiphoniae]PWK26066.1 pectinesterase [Maribacter polysiphoniae]